jgi:hypothetical protein
VHEVYRLAGSDNEIYATFYNLTDSGIRSLSGEKWDSLRGVADRALFPGYEKHIRFAALALDGLGLTNYGSVSVTLREDMIAHRASVFEENAVLFMARHGIRMDQAHELPPGYRATWGERGRLCVAKLASSLSPGFSPSAFGSLLLINGATSEDDRFVEVHVWGPMTRRTFARAIVRKRLTDKAERAIVKALREKLKPVGVKLEEA